MSHIPTPKISNTLCFYRGAALWIENAPDEVIDQFRLEWSRMVQMQCRSVGQKEEKERRERILAEERNDD